MLITKKYLRDHPKEIFVFGDNLLYRGKKGGAILRDEPNTYGFVTKKYPNYKEESYYRPEEYLDIYHTEIEKLKGQMRSYSDYIYLISAMGSGLANKYGIFEEIIELNIKKDLSDFPNVRFLF